MRPDEFIQMVSSAAKELQLKYGIFASITIAQAALETGWGRFIPVDKESGQFSYNLFGVKGKGPAGSVTCETWEVENGVRFTIDAQFRAYHSFEESLLDHNEVLLLDRYAPVRNAITPEEAAKQIYKCGYATDPDYPKKLVSIIDQFNLKQHDISTVPGPFLDVPGDHWAAKFVEAVKDNGIMVGRGNGLFEGERPVTRYELAVVIAKALKLV